MRCNSYTPEMEAFLRDNAGHTDYKGLTESLNLRFGTDKTETAVRSRCKLLKIRIGHRSTESGTALWPADIRSFIRSHCPGLSSGDTADAVNRRFGTGYTEDQVRSFRKNHRVPSGHDCRFRRGRISANRGLRQEDFMSPEGIERSKVTRFRTGHRPHNRVPVGTETVKSDGYIWRKIAEPDVWRQRHILEWESRNGPLPDGMLVTFLNGDRTDFRPENLMAVTLDENAHLRAGDVRHLGDPELTKAQALTWRLGRKIYGKSESEGT